MGSVVPWAFAALALMATGWVGSARGRVAWSWLSLPVLGYASVIVANTLVLSRAYTPAGLYHPLLLATAFLVARSLADRAAQAAAIAALACGGILAVWGLVQSGLLGMARATAIFETPATYAAALNLMLVPLLAAVILGQRDRALLIVAALLAAAQFAADSRGGQLALFAGVGIALLLGLRTRTPRLRAMGFAAGLLAVGWVAAAALRSVPAPEALPSPTADVRAESSLSRLELSALSWNAWRESPLTGTGYLTFRYTLEQGRPQVPSYGETDQTWFVHNDYLQTLQELGVAGFVAFLGLTVLPLLLVYRRLPAMTEKDRPVGVACTAALGAMSIHALVDFPFYVPVCLVLYGALLGALDARLGVARAPRQPRAHASRWLRAARAGALAIGALILLRPVAAEVAAEWGLRRFAAGEGQKAAFWLGAAQRLDSKDWRYHWYAGQFWDAQAVESGRPEAATLAAEAFATGFEANSLEARNLLGKISVHRRYRQLLEAPADPGVLRQWRAQAQALAPLSPQVRRELAR